MVGGRHSETSSTNPDNLALTQVLSPLAEEKLAVDEEEVSNSYHFLGRPLAPEEQVKRDFEMIRGAIEKPGEDPFSAEVLKKLYTLLYFGGVHYHKDGSWQPWDLPLASVITHGSRVIIQFPRELNEKIIAWLFEERVENYRRSAATHGISASSSHAKLSATTEKLIQEIKVSLGWAGVHAVRLYTAYMLSYLPVMGSSLARLIDTQDRHFGVNLALNGAGELHPSSGKVVSNNGENGHLYIYYTPTAADEVGGLLVGIEQSAPGKEDQNGGSHSVFATHHTLSATGGQDFAKTNELKGLGPSRYYDGLFLNLTREKFDTIMNQTFSLEMLQSTGHVSPKESQSPSPRQLPRVSSTPSLFFSSYQGNLPVSSNNERLEQLGEIKHESPSPMA